MLTINLKTIIFQCSKYLSVTRLKVATNMFISLESVKNIRRAVLLISCALLINKTFCAKHVLGIISK